jgi:hypothetical protein
MHVSANQRKQVEEELDVRNQFVLVPEMPMDAKTKENVG